VKRLLALATMLLVAASAHAQPSEDDPLFSPYVSGEESDALAALRRAEIEMFRPELARPQRPLSDTPTVTVGVPRSVTSDPAEDAAEPRPRSTPWLEGLRLPDLPVQWHDQVVEYLDYFRDTRRGQNLMRAWMRRSTRYGAMIARALREQELPEDLRCVAMAESGFDPTIRSHRGAVGMWQFVSRTGAEYGLEQNRWMDQRMDPVASTHAAARMLGDLHRRFGSWELALAAYNMGYGALLRAIRKYNTNDYWVLASLEAGLPFETTIYVAKIMACSVVFRNPERFGFADLSQDPPIEVEPFELPGGVNIAQLARAAGVPRDELAALNPHYPRGRTPPGRATYTVHVPSGRSEQFMRAWNRIRPRQPVHRPYVMRFGEDLGDVARRYRTSVRALRELNAIEGGEDVGAGTAILVPAVEPREEAAPASDEDRPVVAVPDRRFAYPGRVRVFYATSRDDTPESIARHFGVRVDDLRLWNHLDASARLQSGMYLQLYVTPGDAVDRAVLLRESDVSIIEVGTERFFDEHEDRQGRVRFRYTVVEGDNLTRIGNRFGISVGSLARINRMGRRTDLRIGQQVIVYADPSRVPARFRRAQTGQPTPPRPEPDSAQSAVEEEPAETADEGADAEADQEADAEPAPSADAEGPPDAGSDPRSDAVDDPRDANEVDESDTAPEPESSEAPNPTSELPAPDPVLDDTAPDPEAIADRALDALRRALGPAPTR